FDVVLVPIFPHCLLERQALLGRIGGRRAPAQRRHEVGNRRFVALDGGDLITHPLAHLRLAVGPTSSPPDKLDFLLTLSWRGGGEQTHDTMLGEYGLSGAR